MYFPSGAGIYPGVFPARVLPLASSQASIYPDGFPTFCLLPTCDQACVGAVESNKLV